MKYKVIILRLGITVVGTFTLFFFGLSSAFAAGFVVDTANDTLDAGDCETLVAGDLPGADGNISFREAVCVANSNSSADAITFHASLNGSTITFGSAFPAIESDGNRIMVIDGNEQITLDGDGTYVGLSMTTSVSNITIKGLTFQNFVTTALNVAGTGATIGTTAATEANYFLQGASGAAANGIRVFGSNHTLANNYVGVESDGTTVNAFDTGISIRDNAATIVISDSVIASGASSGCGIQFPDAMGVVTIQDNNIGVGSDGTTDLDGYAGICDQSAGTYTGAVTIGGNSAGNTISGHVDDGISLQGTYSGNVYIQGNYIGLDGVVSNALANNRGVYIDATCASGTCLIGGSGNGRRNYVSGNTAEGLYFDGNSSGWQVVNSYFGVDGDVGGPYAEANGTVGIHIEGGADDNEIGDNSIPNIISGNTSHGILINSGTGTTTILGNYIGVNPAGDTAMANGGNGVLITGGSPTVTFGTSADTSASIVVSGNTLNGIVVGSMTAGTVNIYGSLIGLNAAGDAAVANTVDGIAIADDNAGTVNIGNTRTAGFNVIGGNGASAGHGIQVGDGAGATIKGNFIGVDSTETTVLGNFDQGLYIEGDDVTIGGTETGEGNIITGHDAAGDSQILVHANATGTNIYGNYIGLDTSGDTLGSSNKFGILDAGATTTIGSTTGSGRNYIDNMTIAVRFSGATGGSMVNNYIGVKPDGTAGAGSTAAVVIGDSSSSITIGGFDAGEGNVISNNTGDGIDINGAATVTIVGNYIGINPDGDTAMANGDNGIEVQDGNNIFIGCASGGATHAKNVISGNTANGIKFTGTASINNSRIEANYIGLNVDGDAIIANGEDGIYVTGVDLDDGILIGADDADSRNVISGNGDDGIDLYDADSVTVSGNYIGLASDGSTDLGNTGNGVFIRNGSSSNVIGYAYAETAASAKANTINYNDGSGIYLDGATTVQNSLRGNIIAGGNTVGRVKFTNSPNNSILTTGTTLTTNDTSRVAGTTDETGKVDIFSIAASGGAVSYEGSATIADSAFQLDMDFTAVEGDGYYFQITQADGDSSGFSSNTGADADGTAPSDIVVTSGDDSYTTLSAHTFEGTKDAYSNLLVNAVEEVAADLETTWTYSTTLVEGNNVFVFRSEDYSDNASGVTRLNMVYDITDPVAPTVESTTAFNAAKRTVPFTIWGTKESGTAIWFNGEEVVALDSAQVWAYQDVITPGTYTYTFIAMDGAGNTSDSVEYSVTFTQIYYAGGGGSGSGSNPQVDSTGDDDDDDDVSLDTGDDDDDDDVSIITSPDDDDDDSLVDSTGDDDDDDDDVSIITSPDDDSATLDDDDDSLVDSTGDDDDDDDDDDMNVVVTEATVDAVEELYPVYEVTEEIVEEVIEEVVEETPVEETTESVFVTELSIEIPTLTSASTSTETETDTEVIETTTSAAEPEAVIEIPLVTRSELFTNEVYIELTTNEDGDDLPDVLEVGFDVAAPTSTGGGGGGGDLDGDGLSNQDEALLGTNPFSSDSDGDGITDYDEAKQGLSPTEKDSDGDGVTDGEEEAAGTDPLDKDSDNDGYLDSEELNSDSDPNSSEDIPKDEDGDGAPDVWKAKYEGLQDVDYSEEYEGVELSIGIRDTDKDGLPDVKELYEGTDPTNGDTDGDGISDGDEYYTYKTDATQDTPTEEVYQPRLSNVESKGTVFVDEEPLIRGVSAPDSDVLVYFIPRETRKFSFDMALRASLFGEKEAKLVEVETRTDGQGKFLTRPQLRDGDYLVMVRTLDSNGKVVNETLPYELSIDSDLEQDIVDPYQLDDQKINVRNLRVITIDNSRPYLYGKAEKGYEVVTSWASEVHTSSLLVDQEEGEFITLAPAELEDGDHDLYIYAMDPSKNLYSSVIEIDFKVLTGSLYEAAQEDSATRMSLFLYGVGGIFVVMVFWLIARARKERFQN